MRSKRDVRDRHFMPQSQKARIISRVDAFANFAYLSKRFIRTEAIEDAFTQPEHNWRPWYSMELRSAGSVISKILLIKEISLYLFV